MRPQPIVMRCSRCNHWIWKPESLKVTMGSVCVSLTILDKVKSKGVVPMKTIRVSIDNFQDSFKDGISPALVKKLKENGFDLHRKITATKDPLTLDIIYSQEEL